MASDVKNKFTFTVVPCHVTWAIMCLHRVLSSACCISWVGLQFQLLLAIILSTYVCLCLPRALLPSMVPVMLRCSILCFLIACPKNLSCRFLICFSNSLFVSACWSTLSFVLLAIHGTRIILRIIHISVASNLSLASLFNVHVSHPYVSVDQT